MLIIHGRVYAESEGWTMPSPEFRILVAPAAVTDQRHHLLEIDALAVFLQSLPGPPCRLSIFSFGDEQIVAERFPGLLVPATRQPLPATIADAKW